MIKGRDYSHTYHARNLTTYVGLHFAAYKTHIFSYKIFLQNVYASYESKFGD